MTDLFLQPTGNPSPYEVIAAATKGAVVVLTLGQLQSARPGSKASSQSGSARATGREGPIDLVVGYHKANTPPILRTFLSRIDDLTARISSKARSSG